MKNTLLLMSAVFLIFSCKDSESNIQEEKGTAAVNADKEEWISLINGKNLEDWTIKITGHEVDSNYKDTFRVEDSMIRVSYDNYESFDGSFGHLYYKKPFSYYRLRLDYRFVGEQVAGGASWANRNSGIMLHAQSAESNSLGQFFPVSIEFQFLGGLGEGERPTGNVCTPGTVIKVSDTLNYQHCINSNSKTYAGDQWVSAEAIVLGDEKIMHIIEGDTVMSYTQPIVGGGLISQGQGSEWKSMGIDNEDEWLAKEGQPLKEGYIVLQGESTPIDFKNIELLDLSGCMDKKAKNYKSYYVKEDNTKCIYD